MNKKEFVQLINKLRLNGGWYQYFATVDGKQVAVKGYSTWLQVFTIDGIDNGNPMEQSVTEFKNHMLNAI